VSLNHLRGGNQNDDWAHLNRIAAVPLTAHKLMSARAISGKSGVLFQAKALAELK